LTITKLILNYIIDVGIREYTRIFSDFNKQISLKGGFIKYPDNPDGNVFLFSFFPERAGYYIVFSGLNMRILWHWVVFVHVWPPVLKISAKIISDVLLKFVMEREPEPVKSKEYLEQVAIEAIARSRYPETKIKEILPGFDAGENNYVWLVILETNKPFDNTLTTVDTNDILEWQEKIKKQSLGDGA
jgi:hypothetical protein